MSLHPDLQAYLQGLSDDVILLGVNVSGGNIDMWFTDQLYDFSAVIDGQSVELVARACMAPWPKRLGNGDFSSQVSIDNVDNVLTAPLMALGFSELNVDLYLFLESHLKALGSLVEPVAVMPFRSREAIPGIVAQFDCRRPDIINKKFPIDIYEPDKYPGLEQS